MPLLNFLPFAAPAFRFAFPFSVAAYNVNPQNFNLALPGGASSVPRFLRLSKHRGDERFKTGFTSSGWMRRLLLIIADWIECVTRGPGAQEVAAIRVSLTQRNLSRICPARSCVRPALRKGPQSGDQGLPTALVSLARGRNGVLFGLRGPASVCTSGALRAEFPFRIFTRRYPQQGQQRPDPEQVSCAPVSEPALPLRGPASVGASGWLTRAFPLILWILLDSGEVWGEGDVEGKKTGSNEIK